MILITKATREKGQTISDLIRRHSDANFLIGRQAPPNLRSTQNLQLIQNRMLSSLFFARQMPRVSFFVLFLVLDKMNGSFFLCARLIHLLKI